MCHSLGCYSLESIPTATLLYRMVYTSNYNTRMIVPRAQAPHITKSTGDIELIYKTAHKQGPHSHARAAHKHAGCTPFSNTPPARQPAAAPPPPLVSSSCALYSIKPPPHRTHPGYSAGSRVLPMNLCFGSSVARASQAAASSKASPRPLHVSPAPMATNATGVCRANATSPVGTER